MTPQPTAELENQLALVHSRLDAMGVPACETERCDGIILPGPKCPRCNGTGQRPVACRITARLDWVANKFNEIADTFAVSTEVVKALTERARAKPMLPTMLYQCGCSGSEPYCKSHGCPPWGEARVKP